MGCWGRYLWLRGTGKWLTAGDCIVGSFMSSAVDWMLLGDWMGRVRCVGAFGRYRGREELKDYLWGWVKEANWKNWAQIRWNYLKWFSRNRIKRGNRLDWSIRVVYWRAVVSTVMNNSDCKMRGIAWRVEEASASEDELRSTQSVSCLLQQQAVYPHTANCITVLWTATIQSVAPTPYSVHCTLSVGTLKGYCTVHFVLCSVSSIRSSNTVAVNSAAV